GEHRWADAVQTSKRNVLETLRQVVNRQEHQPVRLFQVAGDFREQSRRRNPDGTRQPRPEIAPQLLLDASRQSFSALRLLQVAAQTNAPLVDRVHALDGCANVDALQNAVMHVDVEVRPRSDEHDARAKPPRFGNERSYFDTGAFSLVAG